MDDATYLLGLLGDKSRVAVELGTFQGLDGNRVLVDVGGGRIPAEVTTAYRPIVGEPVQLLFVNGKPYMLGAAVPKPGNGVVSAVDGDMATVNTDQGPVVADYPDGLLVAPGDFVKLYWSDGPFILQVRSTTPDEPVVPVPPVDASQTRQETFTATQSGSWQLNGSRWVSGQPRASDGYVGAWHYGSKVRDTIPAGAQLLSDANGVPSFEVFFRYASRFGNPPNVGLHSQANQGGQPDVFDAFPWPVSDGWNTVPAPHAQTWFDQLKGGGSKLGVVLNHGGLNRFLSTGEDPQSGALRIGYRT
jgi:hypothetical protein